jgi:hypothetical protein
MEGLGSSAWGGLFALDSVAANSATAINSRVHLVVGGFHLAAAADPDIEKAVTALRDRFRVEYVAPGTVPENQPSHRSSKLSAIATFTLAWAQR